MSLRLHVLGSSGSWPGLGRATAGFVVDDGATRIVMDLGFGTMERLVDPLDIDAVVISHRHPDHCVDVLGLYHLYAYGDVRRSGVPLVGPASVIETLAGFVDATATHHFWRVFDPQPVAGGDRHAVGTLDLSFVDMDHSVPAIGIGVVGGGRKLFYTGDTGLVGEWWASVDRPDVLVCEASWQGDGDGGDFTQHLTAGQAGKIASMIDAGRLMLTHVKPGLDPVRSVAEARAVFSGPVSHADPGVTLEV